jgi:hypothetical protein
MFKSGCMLRAVAGLRVNTPPFLRSAQTILAILLASAIAATLAGRRASRANTVQTRSGFQSDGAPAKSHLADAETKI